MEISNKYTVLKEEELKKVEGGVYPLVVAGVLIGTPFVLGAIAGGMDEYARKKGHR